MGLKQESESARVVRLRYSRKCHRRTTKESGYKTIVETSDPPTALEQVPAEHAVELLLSAIKDGGHKEAQRLLNLRLTSLTSKK